MNRILTFLPPLWRGTLACCALTLLSPTFGADFTYNSRDLMLGFRQTGGSQEFEANLGPLTNYAQLAPGTTLTLTQFTGAQLTAAFSSMNALTWSVSGAVYGNLDPGDATYPKYTIWATRPRLDPTLQSDPWLRKSTGTQGGGAAQIYSIGHNAQVYSSANPADPLKNTATAVALPAGDRLAYSSFVGALGNLQNTFQGDIENTTPDDFDSAGQPSRSDLYEMKPGSGSPPGTYLGYFELHADGSLSFTAAGGTSPGPLPPPSITGIVRQGDQVQISFTSTNDVTAIYNLVYAPGSALNSPVSSWTVSTNSATGTGGTLTLTDTATTTNRFYVVKVHR